MRIGNHQVKIESPETATVGCQRVTLEDVQKLLNEMRNYTSPPLAEINDWNYGSFVGITIPRDNNLTPWVAVSNISGDLDVKFLKMQLSKEQAIALFELLKKELGK